MDNNSLSHTKWTCKYHIVFDGVNLYLLICFNFKKNNDIINKKGGIII